MSHLTGEESHQSNDVSAIWRRLDTPGHDAALVTANGDGWMLIGSAVFRQNNDAVCVRYTVDLDNSWATRCGHIEGFAGSRTFAYEFLRAAEGWYLDGRLIDGLGHLAHLDYGFTPATNFQQLKSLALAPGQAADLTAVWFDIDADTLITLPQHYARRSATTYWYSAPHFSYEALLEVSPNGFVRSYPGLWEMEG